MQAVRRELARRAGIAWLLRQVRGTSGHLEGASPEKEAEAKHYIGSKNKGPEVSGFSQWPRE